MSRAIALAGFMGTGKSTVGAELAAQLGMPFVDADVELERREGRTIAEIFSADGETYFRARERELLLELSEREDIVIATGGGMVVNPDNRRRLLERCLCIGLNAPADVVLERVGGEAAAQTRPMLRGGDVRARIVELLAARAPAYAELHYRIETAERTPQDIAAEIAAIARTERRRIPVNIPPGHRYDIVMGDGVLDHLGAMIAQRGWSGPAAVVTDDIVGPLYAERAVAALARAGISASVVVVPHGEQNKTLATVEHMYRAFSERGMDRQSAVIALGGGVLGDTAGFAAATYLRGVPFVQAPTTLLAMADSSIGGKVGVDTPFGKNLVGAFKQPDLVAMDTGLLRSLPQIEVQCGLAEIIKAALIRGGGDYAAIDDLRRLGGAPTIDDRLLQLLTNAIFLKREVVEEDPEERGRRALLNLGHTFGHGIEAYSGLRLKHGYAVSLGMVCALRLSNAICLCEDALVDDVLQVLRGVGLPTGIDDVADLLPGWDVDEIWRLMQSDKKKRAGRLRFVLLSRPGDVFVRGDVEESQARAALASLG
jgi:shikimate kinase/3-dehydroquinate synthase